MYSDPSSSKGIDKTKKQILSSHHQGFPFIFHLSMSTPPFSHNPSITTSLCPEWIRYQQLDSHLALFHLLYSFLSSVIHRYTHSLPHNYPLQSILTTQFISSHLIQIMDIVTDPVCRNLVLSFYSIHSGTITNASHSTLSTQSFTLIHYPSIHNRSLFHTNQY